jgi:hypothetical protein
LKQEPAPLAERYQLVHFHGTALRRQHSRGEPPQNAAADRETDWLRDAKRPVKTEQFTLERPS